MKRDRTRTEVISTLLDIAVEISGGEQPPQPISVQSFAEKAGLSRQALHQSHADIVSVLQLINKGIKTKPAQNNALLEKYDALKTKCAELSEQLAGAVEQNNELIMAQKNLEKQLASRGLSLVKTKV